MEIEAKITIKQLEVEGNIDSGLKHYNVVVKSTELDGAPTVIAISFNGLEKHPAFVDGEELIKAINLCMGKIN